jgi:hypothetical protein
MMAEKIQVDMKIGANYQQFHYRHNPTQINDGGKRPEQTLYRIQTKISTIYILRYKEMMAGNGLTRHKP